MNLKEKLFYKALFIRRVEDKIIELYSSDKIQSPVHLSNGQEAVAVGICQNLTNDDVIFPNYRGHSYFLAKGGPLNLFFAELYGKQTGISKGKAGSMHLSYPKKNIMGASAVVASTISHAVGYALGNKLKKNKTIVVTIFGDGATEQGVLYESLNFASLNNIPIIFLCENNSLAVHSKIKDRQSYDISKIGNLFKIDTYSFNKGSNINYIYNAFNKVILSFKNKPRPIFLEIKTFRYKEHVGVNDDFSAGYRSYLDYEKWIKNDDLINNKKLISKFELIIKKEINNAIEFAESSPFPSKNELLKDVL